MRREDVEAMRREHHQLSAAEVPGFHARTTIDDMIGKLFALRQQIRAPVPTGLEALLDDAEAIIEQAVDLALDPDAPEINDAEHLRIPDGSMQRWSNHYAASASGCVTFCSCGAPTIG